jgi:hypothetical protein
MGHFTKIFLAMLLLVGCSTPGQVRQIDDDKLIGKGNTLDGNVGLNSKNQVIIRSKKSAADELRVQDMVNMKLREDLDRDIFELKTCRQQRADRRLGGDGRVAKIPDVDGMRPAYEVREQLGLDKDGDLSVVQEQSFEERLKAERQYEQTLRTMSKTIEGHVEECSLQLADARRSAGLPGQKTTAQGYFDARGNWIETKRGAHSIDDEIEMQAERKDRAQDRIPTH